MKVLGRIPPPLRYDRWDVYGRAWTWKRIRYRLAFWGEKPWIDPRGEDSAAHWIILVLAVAIVGLAMVWWKQKHGA